VLAPASQIRYISPAMTATPALAAPAAAPASPLALFASVSRLHIVAIATLGTFTFGWLFTGHFPWLAAMVSAVDWFAVNLLNRVVDLSEDRANGITGADFAARHRRRLLTLGLGVLAATFIVLTPIAPWLAPLRVCYHALGASYNWAVLPGRRRIKQLYFWKNTASAVGFLITVFGYPLALAHKLAPGITPATVVVSALFFFLFELSYEVIYDLRDAPGDRGAGVRTYAVVHGQRVATAIVDALVLAAIATLLAGFDMHVLPWRIVVMACAPVVQLVVYKRALARGIRPDDCIRLTWIGAALLLLYQVWIAAGLPWVNA
jgi:4-hydroxybenzoate polyprenyltransferase